MFWIGFIVGTVSLIVLSSLGLGLFVLCMKEAGISWDDFNQLVEANEAALLNRDSRIEVWSEDTDEKVFEAEFTYPWSDDVND